MKAIYTKVHQTIMDVWHYDIKSDYNHHFLFKEDTLKNAMYHHIRNRLGDTFIKDNNLAIFTEYYIETNQKIDLVVVKIDVDKAKNDYLGNCVEEIIAIVEMKYKGPYVSEKHFINDVEKILVFTNQFTSEATKFFLAFIREKYFLADEVTNFLSFYEGYPSGRIVELLSYGSVEEDDMVWKVFEP